MIGNLISTLFLFGGLVLFGYSFLLLYLSISNTRTTKINYIKRISFIIGCTLFAIYGYAELSMYDNGICFWTNLFSALFSLASLIWAIFVNKHNVHNEPKK